MKKIAKYIALVLSGTLVMCLLVLGVQQEIGTRKAEASVNFLAATTPVGQVKGFSLFSGTTTSATSTNTTDGGGYFVIAGAKRVEMFFGHGGIATTSTGTSTFSVQVSPDGINWYNFGRLVDSTSTTPLIQSTVSITGPTTTKMYSVDLRTDAFYALRCIVLEGTITGASGDGEHTCAGFAEF